MMWGTGQQALTFMDGFGIHLLLGEMQESGAVTAPFV